MRMSKVGSTVPISCDMARELLNVKLNHLDICTLEKQMWQTLSVQL